MDLGYLILKNVSLPAHMPDLGGDDLDRRTLNYGVRILKDKVFSGFHIFKNERELPFEKYLKILEKVGVVKDREDYQDALRVGHQKLKYFEVNKTHYLEVLPFEKDGEKYFKFVKLD